MVRVNFRRVQRHIVAVFPVILMHEPMLVPAARWLLGDDDVVIALDVRVLDHAESIT